LHFYNIQLNASKPLPEAYPKELKTLGDHLRKARLDKGLFQKDLAELIGVTEKSTVNWEWGIAIL